jgi:hypothetical protein
MSDDQLHILSLTLSCGALICTVLAIAVSIYGLIR